LFRELRASREVIWEMLKRDLRSQYRQSFLGVFLSVLPALATTGWAVLFRNANLINAGDVKIPYPFYVLCGMMIWAAFLESIDAPIGGLLSEQGLISKANVPPEAVIAAKLGQVFVNFFVKSLVVAVAAVWYQIHIPGTVVLVPLAMLCVVSLGCAIGLLLAPINFLYRDISKAVPVVTTFWFFLTPIIFTSPNEGLASLLVRKLNPVTPLLVTVRDLTFRGYLSMRTEFELAAAFTFLLLIVGITFHRVAMPIVLDRTNS